MTRPATYVWAALAGAVIPTLILIALSLRATGGIWEYALDDVYIHLAMSESVARGEYGVNAGEPASASSSILYSYLLAPLAGTPLHVWWPLVLGLLGLIAFALLWGRVMAEAAAMASPGVQWMPLVMAVAAPVFLNVPALSVIGMEHILHVAATLAVLVGLLDMARTGRIGWLLVAGLVLNPLLRFEGAAILVLGCGVIALAGRPMAALGIFAAACVPLAAHFAYMSALGLDMLPNSVNAKAAVAGGGDREVDAVDPSRLDQIVLSWRIALASASGRMLISAVMILVFGLLLARRQIRSTYALIGWMAAIAAFAHVTLGSAVWYYRYEVYVWAFCVGTGAVLISMIRLPNVAMDRVLAAAFAVAVAYGGWHYLYTGFVTTPQGSAAIAAQQRQMARFIDGFWKGPVAVNDLGHVAFNNPQYVLDLWGLANADALKARLRGDDPLWADKLADKYGVGVAMIYDHWLGKDIGPDWVEVAEMTLTIPTGTLGGPTVSIYATGPETIEPLTEALKDFAPTLPGTTVLTFKEGTGS